LGKAADMLETIRYGDEHVAAYATVRDFCKTFAEELDGLYLLSLLLTGDNDKAEQCVLYALEECADETGVFRQCVSSWTRLAIIRHAIQMIRPVPGRWDSFSIISLEGTVASAENNPFAAIRALGAFERFVFVMSILEGWSEQDCAIRLGCARRDVRIARVSALKCVGSAMQPTQLNRARHSRLAGMLLGRCVRI
jgi:DNA-directed RNA polymerase specialized sigma24 family protein